jgi:hypothetical protein
VRRIAPLWLVLFALSCSHHDATPADPNVISATGVVQHQDIEGGFFGLLADDGTKYDPGTLPYEFQKDGLRVKFTARKTNAMTIRMWGTPVKVEHIELLK